ncbi:MAG: DNA-binding response regulator [Bacteroidetes bacterium]|nr:MAG: DNA-binding response regulator [Bacteroidota bacterium]
MQPLKATKMSPKNSFGASWARANSETIKKEHMKAIVVDDELHCREVLRIMLEMHCPTVHLLAECEDGPQALAAIEKLKPDIVFMDIEMPGMNAFETLQQVQDLNFQIVFTTAYDKYAIKAIKFSALDYLLKPIDADELMAAVHKATQEMAPVQQAQLEQLRQSMLNPQSEFKLMIAGMDGPRFIPTSEILFAEAQNNYTRFHLKNNKKMLASKTLLEFENLLGEHGFMRVHKSYLINVKYADRYLSIKGTVLMEDGIEVDVSRRKKDALLDALYKK